ncbi:MAG: alpha-L-fucosidase [Candidatus Aminicenantes bacterium]|jgi:alpha-L-fucosidase|nr:alpha-L-fucosidase [Candidatus Aminicenantes bacterium]
MNFPRTAIRRVRAFALWVAAAACLCSAALPAFSQNGRPVRTQWLQDAKFGLFIHWGVYSLTGREEWARQLLQIPLREYDGIAAEFNPAQFDPDAWVALAKEAGVKYIVITSKHHDGFCIFDSRLTEFDVMSARYGKDILAQLAEACRRQKMPLGFYYSIMDWHHPDYLPRRSWETDRTVKDADFNRYLDYMKGQVEELVVKYGPAVLWFDGEWEHSSAEFKADDVEALLLRLKPDILINDRLFNREPGRGDFGTPENYVPATGLRNPDGSPRLWEACTTMNFNGWGYNHYETEFHSATQLIRQLIEIAGKGGNLLLNVGPTPQGTIQPEFQARLQRIGEWLKVNGEAVYGTTAGVFDKLPFFGRCTVKGNRLYIHVMGWPEDKRIRLPGLRTFLRRVSYLAEPGRELNYRRYGKDIVISLPDKPLDPDATVICVDLQGPPQVDPYEIRPGDGGRIELPVTLADIRSQMGQRAYLDFFYRTTLLANWQNVNDFPEWEFIVEKDGTYEVQASYACGGERGSSFAAEFDDGTEIPGVVRSSPSLYFPQTFSLGTVELKEGKHGLRFKIRSIVNNNAMRLEKVVLLPLSR